MDFLEAGRDVLCEKPIANNSINARAMIEASSRYGARLAINMVRRRFDSYRAAKLLLRKSFLGRIEQIDYKQGNYKSWPFCSSYILHKHESGGGVLIDWGIHALDILNSFFGADWELKTYRDDGFGRVESNCDEQFSINVDGSHVPCHFELSYVRQLGACMKIRGDLGELVVGSISSQRDISYGPR